MIGEEGDGAAGRPLSLFTVSDLGISSDRDVSTGNTSSSISYDGLVNALYSLKSQYVRDKSCRWIFHRDVCRQLRKLKTGEGDPIWQPSMQAGQPPTLLGVPVEQSEYAPNFFNSGQRIGIVGALRHYGVVKNSQIQTQVLKEKYALQNQNAVLIAVEIGGQPLIEEAFAGVTPA